MKRRNKNVWLKIILVILVVMYVPVGNVAPALLLMYVGYKAISWFKVKTHEYEKERRAFHEYYKNRSQQ